MAVTHGFQSILGVGSEVTFGTPVVATQRVCYIEESLDETFTEILDNALCGTAARMIGQQGTGIVEGGFSYPWRAETGDLVLSRFFGTYTVDSPSVGRNTFSLDPSIDGDGLTVAIDKTVDVFEFAGYKTSMLTITGNPSDGIIIASEGFAQSLNPDSVINDTAVLEALPEKGNLILFQDLTFRIADLADALQASDAIDVSEMSIEINRNLEPIEVNSRRRTEALENAFRESMLTFTIPQMQDMYFIDAHRNHTPLQADMVIVNGANVKTIRLPLLIVTDYSANISGPEFVPVEVTCQIIPDPDGLNAFMTLAATSSEIEIIEE